MFKLFIVAMLPQTPSIVVIIFLIQLLQVLAYFFHILLPPLVFCKFGDLLINLFCSKTFCGPLYAYFC